MENQKELALHNRTIAAAGQMEAKRLGIDKSEEYLDKLAKFEERLLFDMFIAKAVVPGIRVPEAEAQTYYQDNIGDYSSPLMLKMASLVFTEKGSAEKALGRLRAGSDLKWVSANSENLAGDYTDVLQLGGGLTWHVPDDLQEIVAQARQGNTFLYQGPQDYYYVLQVEKAFPPVAQPYEEVRQEVGKIIYSRKINEALQSWVKKLKEAYETEVFIVQ